MQLVRNTFNIIVNDATADQLEIELYVYSGTKTTDKLTGSGLITILTSMIPALNQTNNYAIVNIAPYIMDYIDIGMEYNLTNRSTAEEGVWFSYRYRKITSGTPASYNSEVTYAATPGYGKFRDGVTSLNFDVPETQPILITKDTTIYVPVGERYTVPAMDYYSGGAMGYGGTFYNGSSHTTVLATPGTATESVDIISYVQEPIALTTTELYQYDLVSTYVKTHDIVRVSVPDTDYKLIHFMNRWGAIQQMYFFGRTNESFETQGITARRDTKWYVNFDDQRHQYIDFYKNARERITLNSGWQVEANNQLFKELLMSEQVWINETEFGSTKILPVRITSSSLQMKTQRWDKVINYTIEFEKAYDYALT